MHSRQQRRVLVGLGQDPQRLLQQVLQVGEEPRSGSSVERPVVDRDRELYSLPHLDLLAEDDRLLSHRSNGQDRRFRGVDHRGEVVDSEHAEIAHRECPAGKLVGVSLPTRAFAISALPSAEISVTVLRSVSWMTGTMSPDSRATATPT